jgi:aspartate carbamoyltransferase catalytic subunit
MTPRKDLLDIESLSREEIDHLLSAARPFKDLLRRSVGKVPPLRGRHVLTLFFEPSTEGNKQVLRAAHNAKHGENNQP